MSGTVDGRRAAPRGAGREAGFTLLELMIVMGVIAILAGIAIPKLLEGRNSAYENNALGYLRSVHQQEAAFHAREGRWATLVELQTGGYFSTPDLTAFTVILTISEDGGTFQATATPLIQPTKLRHFFVDATGTLRFSVGSPADATSTPL